MPNYFNNAYLNTPNCKMFYDRSVAADTAITFADTNNMPLEQAVEFVQADPKNIPLLADQDFWQDLTNPQNAR